MNRLTHLGALLAVLSFSACGGGGATEETVTDVARSDKQLKDLTADEVHEECAGLAPKVALSKEDTCEFAGLMSAALGQSCEKAKERCMSVPDQPAQLSADCMPAAE